jgi:excisionase family DNA binding protein
MQHLRGRLDEFLRLCADASDDELPVVISTIAESWRVAWPRLKDQLCLPAGGNLAAGMVHHVREKKRLERLLSMEQAAERLGISRKTIYRHKQIYPFVVQVGPRSWRVDENLLAQYLQRRRL